MLPPVISSRPAIIRSVVVLPHPDGPSSTTNSPSWMESDTSLTASTVPNVLLRFSKSNSRNGYPPRLCRHYWRFGSRSEEELGACSGPPLSRVSPPVIRHGRLPCVVPEP